jgi:signal transduction histidine kinase
MSETAPSPREPSAGQGTAAGAADGEASAAQLRELLGFQMDRWDDQRRQLARQLHDSLGSSMTALTMHLALLTQQLPNEKPLLDRGAQMKTLLNAIINTNREIQLALWNDSLEFLGIRPAVTEVVEQFRERQRLVARLSLPEDEISYPRRQAAALMHALDEGLRNIVSHANASEVDVILDDDGEQIMLTVRDNGGGIGARPFDGPQHGLRALRERARYLGGDVTVGPAPQGAAGTRLTLILPRHHHLDAS